MIREARFSKVFEKLSYRIYWRTSALRYRVERRLTRGGVLVCVMAVLAASLGVDLDQSVAHQVFSFLFVLLAVAVVSGLSFRGDFGIARNLPRFASVGERLVYTVRVRNRTRKTQAGLTLLENLTDGRMTFAQFLAATHPARARSFRLAGRLPSGQRAKIAPQMIPLVPPGGTAEVPLELVPLKRGPLRLTGASIARTDPFGLVRAFVQVRAPDTVVVLPKRYPLPPVGLPGTLKYQQGGVALASSVGESEEFVS
ncbi:MAG: hypothetical protein L0Y58_04245, partial [Verrucomicrobia subdivision 3 bacterium]|nr:hypothetical protein [Limisphaerales bacterium]